MVWPFAISPSAEAVIIEAAESVPDRLRREFLSVASTENLTFEANDVLRAYNAAHANDSTLSSIIALRSELRSVDTAAEVAPWERGYLVARRLRETVGIGNRPLPSFDHIASALGVADDVLTSALISMPEATGIYDALVATNRCNSPSFAISHRHNKAAHRFHFARGLYEFFRGDDDGPWLVTKSLSDQQKQTRAFAAEFLAPAAALRERVVSTSVSADDVDDIASEFGVSPYVVHHQLENHQIAMVVRLEAAPEWLPLS